LDTIKAHLHLANFATGLTITFVVGISIGYSEHGHIAFASSGKSSG